MASDTPTPSSFSRRQKWSIAFNVLVKTVAVLLVVLAVNYISGRFFPHRFYLDAKTRTELSPRTRGLLHSITNRIRITVYYNKSDSLYENVAALVNEYRLLNRNISVETIDYLEDLAQAGKVKDKYKLFSPTDKNLVIFDCSTNAVPAADVAGRYTIVPGDLLGKYVQQQIPSEEPGKLEFIRKPVAFFGEIWFTSALLQVINPRPLKTYFLQGYGGPTFEDDKGVLGFAKFADILRQNYLQVESLPPGTNAVPLDCNLLIIAGPQTALTEAELARIEDYLDQGGRLWVALSLQSVDRRLGLEKTLAKWGVNVTHSIVKDANTKTGSDILVEKFAPSHPIVNPLAGSMLYLVEPRMIGKFDAPANAVDAPSVQAIAFSSTNATLADTTQSPTAPFPLMVTAEKGAPKGATPERGATRILVTGDSMFLGNVGITSVANGDFANLAVNWLLDRTVLLRGVGSKPIIEYQLFMTPRQRRNVNWILLGAIPGGILLLGGLVWLRRRQ